MALVVGKSFNFSSTTAFTAAVIFSIVGGDSFLSADAGLVGDFTLVFCEENAVSKTYYKHKYITPLHREVVRQLLGGRPFAAASTSTEDH